MVVVVPLFMLMVHAVLIKLVKICTANREGVGVWDGRAVIPLQSCLPHLAQQLRCWLSRLGSCSHIGPQELEAGQVCRLCSDAAPLSYQVAPRQQAKDSKHRMVDLALCPRHSPGPRHQTPPISEICKEDLGTGRETPAPAPSSGSSS
jgi:hypothetical protein